MREIFIYLLITARRDRVLITLVLAMVAGTFLGRFLGGIALAEQFQAAAAYAAGMLRLILALGLSVFIATHLRHMEQSRELAVFLSRPVTRADFLLGYYGAACLMALLMAAVATGLIAYAASPPTAGLLAWGITLAAELCVVLAVAIAASLVMKSHVAAILGTLGYYLLARLMVLFAITQASSLSRTRTLFDDIAHWVVNIAGHAVPRLDRFARGDWLVHGAPPAHELWLIAGQTAAFMLLFGFIAWLDFSKREC